MEILLLFFALVFVFGTAVGSFLNVLVDRIPRGESVINSRSHCEHCRHKLSALDLVPLFSYLALGGKCQYCHKHIGYYYPIVEFLTGALFVLSAYLLFPTPLALDFNDTESFIGLFYFLFLVSCLIVIFFTDLKYGIIPFKVALAAIVAAVLFYMNSPLFLNHLYTALSVFAFFLTLFLATRGKGLGFGDVVYAFLMGFALGFPKIIVGLYVAFLTGAVISLILIWTGKKKMKGGTIPFGPFLVGGTVLALFYGEVIIDAVMKYLLN